MADLDQLLIYKLDTALTGDFQEFDLGLNQQIESHLGNEQAGSGTGRVPDGGADIQGGKIRSRIDGFKRAAKDRVEDVVNSGTTAQLLGRNFSRSAIYGRNERGCKASHLLQDERATVLLATKGHVTVASQLLLSLAHKRIQTSLDIWQPLSNMRHKCGVEGLGQELRTASVGDVAIGRMVLEEVHLCLKSLLHGFVALNILLRPVDNTNESKLQGVDTARKDIQRVRTMVHQVQFGQYTDGPSAKGIHMSGELQRLRVNNVDIGRRHSQNKTVGLGDILGNQVSRLFLDIGGLITNRHLEQEEQVLETACMQVCWANKFCSRLTFVRPGKSTRVRLRTWGE